MGRNCTICSNPKVAEIEEAINEGGSVRGVARRFNIQHDALQRHTNFHMGVPDGPSEASTGKHGEFDTLAEIDALLSRNKATLEVSRNPQVCQKLIQQQITLMEMRSKQFEKQSNASEWVLPDLSRLTWSEREELYRLLDKWVGGTGEGPPDLYHRCKIMIMFEDYTGVADQ